MIEILKKRYTTGNTVKIQTKDEVFNGKVIEFYDEYLELETENNLEFISYNTIVRFSFPKNQQVENKKTDISKEKPIKEKTNKEHKIKTKVTQTKKEYKVGDIIPLDELEKLKGKKTVKTSTKKIKPQITKGKGKLTSIGTDFSSLKKLILPEIEEQNKKTVSASGVISKYFGDREFGFITDKFGYEIWFGFRSIIDSDLLNSLRGTVVRANIPVLYTLSKNYKGDTAIFIQKPKTINEIIDISKTYFEKENRPDTSIGILEQIISVYPDNISAKELKREYEKKRFNTYRTRSKYKTYDLNYQKAKRLHNNDKNYEEALKYYFLAFDNNEKRESCIKDISMLYVSMGETEKAIKFIDKYENELPKNITTYNYLENFYGSVKDFEKVIKYIDLLLEERIIENDKRKYSMYLSKKGFALFQIEKVDEAILTLEESISYHSENTYAVRLLEAIQNPDTEELEQIIAEAEFDTFGGGFSKLISNTLENYEHYYGVPPKIIDSGNFSKETLSSIRSLIDKAGRARPRERANYLLTEAKLMTLIEPENEKYLRSVLTRYCNAMALNHISENTPMDVIRNYYLDAFNLEERYALTAPQVALYLISFKSSFGNLLSTKTPSIDDALHIAFEGDYKKQIWEGLLSVFLWNRSISAQIISKMYVNNYLHTQSLFFLNQIDINTTINDSIDDYTNLWNQAREKRQRDYSRWFASIKAISNNSSLESLANQLYDSLIEAKKEWLTQLDVSRLNIISNDIYDVLNQYLQKSGYRDKERSYNFAKAQINQLITEINEKPTKFSYEGFIPLLEKIELLLDKSFKIIEEASTPKVKVSILKESSIVGKGNIIPVQVLVLNSKDSSPIRDITITIENSNNITFNNKNNIYYDSIDGGEHCILKLEVGISSQIIEDKAATLDVECKYKTRNNDDYTITKEQLSLRLYSESEFEDIQNHFAPVADGGPVTDKSMFYGRDEFIDNIIKAILKADSKQIIIYGQKRSGKSSVLYHLKNGLEETNKTFCISFSLGLIVQDLNEFTFYHKILSTIERELKLRKAKKQIVPEFKCLNLKAFKEKYDSNPADGFIEAIEDFKIACIDIEGWSDKKLVVMIDEFTYLYTAIRKGTTSQTIMKQWKAITQSESAKFSVVLVGQDVVPSFKNEDYAKNAFGVIEDIRLTYLNEEDAQKLIEQPILDKQGNSRFIGSAVNTIIDYTSRNPYYIQIFCARLVDYMNSQKIETVTEADIKEIADTFVEGHQALAPEKFDNLIRAGEEHDYKEFEDEQLIKVLRQIATASKNIGVCARDNIKLDDTELENKILKHLVEREVLELKQGNNYKIQVKLFQEWLLRH